MRKRRTKRDARERKWPGRYIPPCRARNDVQSSAMMARVGALAICQPGARTRPLAKRERQQFALALPLTLSARRGRLRQCARTRLVCFDGEADPLEATCETSPFHLFWPRCVDVHWLQLTPSCRRQHLAPSLPAGAIERLNAKPTPPDHTNATLTQERPSTARHRSKFMQPTCNQPAALSPHRPGCWWSVGLAGLQPACFGEGEDVPPDLSTTVLHM